MEDRNEVSLRGRLGGAPQYVEGANGVQSRARLSLCTNYTYKAKDGTKKTKPEWHDVILWGKAADNAAKYLVTGQQVEVRGRIQSREYTSKDGLSKIRKEVIADRVEYGAKPNSANVSAGPTDAAPIATKRQQTLVRQKQSSQIALDEDEAF